MVYQVIRSLHNKAMEVEDAGDAGDDDIQKETSMFYELVKKVDGFNENQVIQYGMGCNLPNLRILSSLCLVPEGIKYTINGKEYTFDTTEHLYTFLMYGIPSNIKPWVRGGVLGDFIKTFGDDAGTSMITKYGDMIGIIPQLIIKKSRGDLRASHGITIKDSSVESTTEGIDYDFWRPILLAKFSVDGMAKDAILGLDPTHYLIEKTSVNLGNNNDWHGKIVYPEPVHDSTGGCTCANPKMPDKSCVLNKVYAANKKAGNRVLGVLEGSNRMGRFLIAIRSEVRLLSGVGGVIVKKEAGESLEEPAPKKKKSKKTHTFNV